MKILLTGFAPFGGETVNPSWQAVSRLPEVLSGIQLVKLEVPTAFSKCGPAVEKALEDCQPEAVICVGQAGGRACLTVERVAINLAEARIPDNEGFQPVDQPVVPAGPAAYFSTLPVKAMVRAVQTGGIPCRLSYSAGTYVCNALMYQALHLAATRFPGLKAGFLHVPYSEAQAVNKPDAPCASLDTIVRGLELAILAAARPQPEAGGIMGTLC